MIRPSPKLPTRSEPATRPRALGAVASPQGVSWRCDRIWADRADSDARYSQFAWVSAEASSPHPGSNSHSASRLGEAGQARKPPSAGWGGQPVMQEVASQRRTALCDKITELRPGALRRTERHGYSNPNPWLQCLRLAHQSRRLCGGIRCRVSAIGGNRRVLRPRRCHHHSP